MGGTDPAYGTFLWITVTCFVNMYFFHPPVTRVIHVTSFNNPSLISVIQITLH